MGAIIKFIRSLALIVLMSVNLVKFQFLITSVHFISPVYVLVIEKIETRGGPRHRAGYSDEIFTLYHFL